MNLFSRQKRMSLFNTIDFPTLVVYYLNMTTQLKEKLNTLIKEERLTAEEIKELARMLSDPWEEARGILKYKKLNALKCQRNLRREWER